MVLYHNKKKGDTMKRQTYVDRSSGVISIFRGKAVVAKPLYENSSKNRFPDDGVLRHAIDNANSYLEAKGHDKQATTSDLMKASFAAGVFAGMALMAGIIKWVGLL
jgi:hypothetical protein